MPLVSLKHLVPLRLGGCKQSHVAGPTYTGGLDNLQRSRKLKHSVTPKNFYCLGAAPLLLLREKWLWGRAPRKVTGVGESIKQTLVLGVDAREQEVS